MVFQHPDPNIPGTTYQAVLDLLAGKNYTLFGVVGPWSEVFYFDTMNGSNVIFYAGHGDQGVHAAGDWSYIWWYEYEYHRMNQVGNGIPPFNDGAPIVNFVHLLACNCGDDNDFIRACWPYYMAWGGPWLENQALFAYSCYVLLADYPALASEIWSRMSEGLTAFTTQEQFNLALELNELAFWVYDVYPGPLRKMATGDLMMYGNDRDEVGGCRIKSVYTGTHEAPVGWFREL